MSSNPPFPGFPTNHNQPSQFLPTSTFFTLFSEFKTPPKSPTCSSKTFALIPFKASLPSLSDNQLKLIKESSHFTLQKRPKITDYTLRRLAQNGQLKDALTAIDSLVKCGIKLRPGTFISLLQSCLDWDSIDFLREFHKRIGSVQLNPLVETKLVSTYAKCGGLKEARGVFDGMHERSLFVWSAMIGAYARERQWEEVAELFVLMVVEGIVPDEFLMPKVLQACASLGYLRTGESIHSIVIRNGMDSSLVYVHNAIMAMYAKCGKLDSAKLVFEKMRNKDRVTWNSMISAHCQCGESEKAEELFNRMQVEGIEPGLVTWNALIASYTQSGDCCRAMELMKKMETSGIAPDVFTWTSMISGFAQNARRNQALDLFREMWLKGVQPNGVTITSVLFACTSQKAFEKAIEIHSLAVKLGHANGTLVGNSLIDMYAKYGKLEDAQRVFEKMTERDVFTWNSIIAAYVKVGYCGKAHELFEKMQKTGVQRNVVSWNVMISGYMQNGDEDQAIELFHKMETKGIQWSVSSWNSLIAGSLQNGSHDKALKFFRQMQSLSMKPNSVTILSILPACANLLTAKKVKEIHCFVLHCGLDSKVSIMNSFIDTYAKSGDIVSAQSIFDRITPKDPISWNSLLSGYALHRQSQIVIELFDTMKSLGIKPNHKTLTCMISAYGLTGMVNEGKELFSSMIEEYQIPPSLEHYAAMVDLLGCSGRLKEAIDFIENMPVEPDFAVWNALLTACRINGNISLAVFAAERLMSLEPGNLLIQKLLSLIYASSGRNEVLRMNKLITRNRSENSAGYSWTEVNNKIYAFSTGDYSMPNNIYTWLDGIVEDVKVRQKDISGMQLDIEEEEKEEVVGIHSEKLAIAFNIIGYPFKQVRVMKSLRMCMGCHKAAKLITSSSGHEIFIKDSKCLHHFRNGKCSCRDYW